MSNNSIFLLLFFSFRLAAQSEKINFPAEYEPSKSRFFVHNEIEIEAPPEIVWQFLMAAEDWPSWYEGAKNVVVQKPSGGRLQADAVFTWQTMGLRFESRVREFMPAARLSWESRKHSIRGYHAWLILPTAKGCRVITEESQNGWLTFFEKIFQPKKLRRLHDTWLRELKVKSENASK
jgi:uncharacterized protein YndB with AHSA1/START domain